MLVNAIGSRVSMIGSREDVAEEFAPSQSQVKDVYIPPSSKACPEEIQKGLGDANAAARKFNAALKSSEVKNPDLKNAEAIPTFNVNKQCEPAKQFTIVIVVEDLPKEKYDKVASDLVDIAKKLGLKIMSLKWKKFFNGFTMEFGVPEGYSKK